jgi:hypothetical protein
MKVDTLHPIEYIKLELIHDKARISALVTRIRETIERTAPMAVALVTGALFTYAVVRFCSALMIHTCYSAVCSTFSQIFQSGL